jgi:2-oxoglutarate ferredoxin oxidoreductase subunit gamma
MVLEEIIIAGFGGQGVMSMGQLLAYAGMQEGKYVSWLPSYGPEQRGGTANCAVVISDEPVGSPVVSRPSAAIILNNPSFDKFEPRVREGGLLVLNSSLVTRETARKDVKVIEVRATHLANELGNSQVANMILLGAYLANSSIISFVSVIQSLNKVLSAEKSDLIGVNIKALEKGASFILEHIS